MNPTIDERPWTPGLREAPPLRGEHPARTPAADPALLVLVRAFVAHLNGCARCAERFAGEARGAGEDDQRLLLLPFWREAPFHVFTARERAALAWAGGVVRLERGGAWEDLRRRARAELSERELAEVALAAVSTQAWSRVAAALGVDPPVVPGSRDAPSGTAAECGLCGMVV